MLSVLPPLGPNLCYRISLPKTTHWSQHTGRLHTPDLYRKKALRAMLHIWILWERCLTQRGVPAEKRSAAQPRRRIQDGGRRTAPLPRLCARRPQCHSQSSFTILTAERWEQAGLTLARCHMGTEATDWLVKRVYLGSTPQTVSLLFSTAGDFLKVNLINTEQYLTTGWGREVAGGCEVGWAAVEGAHRVQSDVFWSAIVALPLEASSTYLG